MKKYVNISQYSKAELLVSCLFIISLLSFIYYKYCFLALPFFWDESWVYGPAVSEMSQRIPSLLPGSIDIDLSRGHPMLFHFLGGLWGNVVGFSMFSLHAFALCISLTLVYLYWHILTQVTDTLIAKLAVILLLSQAIFLAQAAMVLPEVLLTLFAVLSIYLWSLKKYRWAGLTAALCLLTKESGAMLMPALGLAWLMHALMKTEFKWTKAWKILALLILACLPYLLFLGIQKARFGWMLYPNHMDLQVSQPWVFQKQLKYALYYLLFKDGRIVLSLLALISVIWKFRTSRYFWSSIVYAMINIAFIFIWDWSQWITVAIYISFLFLSLGGLLFAMKDVYRDRHYFLLISLIFLIIFMLFTALNFYSSRYILVCIVLYLMLCMQAMALWQNRIASIIATVCLAALCLMYALKRDAASDVNQSFIDYGKAQRALTEYMEDQDLYEAPIFAPFLVKEGLEKRYAGFRSNDHVFTDIKYGFNDGKIMYNILSSRSDEKVSQRNLDDRTRIESKKFESGNAWFILEKYAPK